MAAKKKPTGSKPFAGAGGAKGRKPQGAMGYGTTVSVNGPKGKTRMQVAIKDNTAYATTPVIKSKTDPKKGRFAGSWTPDMSNKAIAKAIKNKASGKTSYKIGKVDLDTEYGTKLVPKNKKKKK